MIKNGDLVEAHQVRAEILDMDLFLNNFLLGLVG